MEQPYIMSMIPKQSYQMKNMISQMPVAIIIVIKVRTIQVMKEVMAQAQATQQLMYNQ